MVVCETRFALRAGAMRLHQSCVFLPPANETYAYDADGNQTLVATATGAWQVEYNGENRPVRWTCGDKTILMTFDHQGRRRLYVEVAAGVTNKLHRFTYNDYVCIARNREIDAQHGVGSGAFVWDPTEPIATRPLMCNPSTETPFIYCHDGNKNVSETVSLYGTIAAHYEYSSFGKVVLVTSENEDQSMANLNPYRFSSEYADDALGLVYYNYRHYNPCDGRWAQRDRISEVVGDDSSTSCLYNFVENNPISLTDIVGFFVNPNWPPVLPSRTTPKSVPAKFENPNWPPVSPSRSRRKTPSPGAKFVRSQVVDFFGTEIAFEGLDYVMGQCDGPCEKMGECMDCCNTVANIAMGVASAKYIADSIGCVRLGHPVLLGKSYSDSVDRILQAQM